jgi:MFS family permease
MRLEKEWRNGWGVILACGMGVGMGSMAAYSLGAFMAPLQSEFGWSRAQVAIALSISSTLSGLTGPFVGFFVDRIGARKIALIGTIFVCAAFAGLSATTASIESYWAHWGLVALGFCVASPVVWTKGVVTRFTAKQGLALSLALCGSNLAGVLAPLLAIALVLHFGWRNAYLGLAAYMLLSTFPAAYAFFYDANDLAKERSQATDASFTPVPPQVHAGLSLSQAARTAGFWLIAVSFLLAGGAIVSLLVHLIPMLEDRGLTPLVSASAASSMSVAAIVGRIGAGYCLDRVFAPRISAVSFALPTIACIGLVLMPANTVWSFISAIFFGFALGAEYNLVAYISSRYFGLKSFGVIYGVMFGIFSLGQAILPPLIGKIYDVHGSYTIALIVIGTAFFCSAALLQFLKPYPDWTAQPSNSNGITTAFGPR